MGESWQEKSPGWNRGSGSKHLSGRSKHSTPRKTRPDSAAVKVLDRYLFKFNRLEQKESDFVVKRMLRNLIALCERLADADRDCRKEWQPDGKMLTREFIVGVLLPNALVAIGEHERTFQKEERPRWLAISDWLNLGHRFEAEIRPLKDDFEKAYKGEADKPAKQSQSRPSEPSAAPAAEQLETTGQKNRKARGVSQFTRAVRKALVNAPRASGLEICRSIDEDGVTPTPSMKGRSYEDTYQNDRRAAKLLDSRFSKIRKQMKLDRILS